MPGRDAPCPAVVVPRRKHASVPVPASFDPKKGRAEYESIGYWPWRPESEVETDERGFKLYDALDALYMDEMVTKIHNWIKSPASSGVVTEEPQSACDNQKNVYILIVEGFLLYNYEPLNELWNRRYFLTLPYEECKRRRSTRVYEPADTPGYFDGHVWPMYLKYKNELEENASMQVVYLDGTKSQEELLSYVYSDIMQELNKLREETGGATLLLCKTGGPRFSVLGRCGFYI
ncbi:PREDICTED: nicotinamide riboside kinase 1 isoform X1 [Lepidothrix coronata]|uniref:Nicotinamide riboside kinase 1 isoform X1 n=1 Tax=Lepidothrix coronata TaxID=321398 RepID=A0A6J0GLC1_9PASS|nr:PREDICTED: nicotinamide riboside kinase 1 isoform X1 [Lepidothrix coronata]